MDVSKINSITSNFSNRSLESISSSASAHIDESHSQKLTSTLDCLAASAIPTINKSSKKVDLPEYIYHITSKENFEKILKDGKMKISDWEKQSGNGCNGIYFVDKDNFLNKWAGREEPDLFGDSGMDIAELLMLWTCKGTNGTVAIKIPTSKLDLSQLRFRPYLEACKESFETLNPDTLEVSSEMVKNGLPIEDLSKYANSDEPIEYVYFGEITPEMFADVSETSFSESMQEMIQNLFN